MFKDTVIEYLKSIMPEENDYNLDELPFINTSEGAMIASNFCNENPEPEKMSDVIHGVRLPLPLAIYEMPYSLLNVNGKCCVVAEEKEINGKLFLMNSFFNEYPSWNGSMFIATVLQEVNRQGEIVSDKIIIKISRTRSFEILIDRAEEKSVNITVEQLKKELKMFYTSLTWRFMFVLQLINCKNVGLKKKYFDKKLIKKRRRINPRAQDSYYVINIANSQKPNKGESLDSYKVRMHICRGHFKNTNGGRFWWNSHVRGKKSLGTIRKDYKLTA